VSGAGAIRVGERDGRLTYLVPVAPEELPPVRGRELQAAWDAAREAAIEAGLDGGAGAVVRAFRFCRQDGAETDLVLEDPDACAWAGAVDRRAGLATRSGLSVCLRLLGLVELIGRAGWTDAFCALRSDGAELHPALLEAAGRLPLTEDGLLDETRLRASLGLTRGA
jgi:hypothetical protein